jgi:hypothetical protein
MLPRFACSCIIDKELQTFATTGILKRMQANRTRILRDNHSKIKDSNRCCFSTLLLRMRVRRNILHRFQRPPGSRAESHVSCASARTSSNLDRAASTCVIVHIHRLPKRLETFQTARVLNGPQRHGGASEMVSSPWTDICLRSCEITRIRKHLHVAYLLVFDQV